MKMLNHALPPMLCRNTTTNWQVCWLISIYIHLKFCCTGRICDENGLDIPQDALPPLHTPQSPDNWTPYWNCLEFETAQLLFSQAQLSAGKIDQLLHLWGSSLTPHQDTPPFADHTNLYKTIDATPTGDTPWESFRLKYSGNKPSEDVPSWVNKSYNVWFQDPQVGIKNILSNTNFNAEIDYAPYHEFSVDSHSQR